MEKPTCLDPCGCHQRQGRKGKLAFRIAEPELHIDSGVVVVRYTILAESKTSGRLTTFNEEHRMRYFFATEIDLLAKQAGFAVEKSEEFLTGKTPSNKTWGVIYLLRRERSNH